MIYKTGEAANAVVNPIDEVITVEASTASFDEKVAAGCLMAHLMDGRSSGSASLEAVVAIVTQFGPDDELGQVACAALFDARRLSDAAKMQLEIAKQIQIGVGFVKPHTSL